ncbi:hypothetical protein BZA70DRAFT_273686 [Myxozyma melibiosi]|uniref:BZIP domain-containing protein n=1 Tax=Myxozyma melibiosi TaxID=54550 RepID=A0ABR1FF96_9ASCO
MAYSSHRGINVSQYIANLNSVEPADFVSTAKTDDISLFTNTQFFDFDMGRSTDAGVAGDDSLVFDGSSLEQDRRRRAPASQKQARVVDADAKQQQPQQQQQQQQFNYLPGHFLEYPEAAGLDVKFQSNPLAAEAHNLYAPLLSDSVPLSPSPAPTPASESVSYVGSPAVKRPGSLEDAQRFAAEEDKRRRNTAASARFRIKKKQREQQMERAAKDLQDKVQQLETKVMQLEMENKWLKNLVVEKNEAKAVSQIMNTRPQDAASDEAQKKISSE